MMCGRSNRSERAGFTLVELMVVILILGFLATLLFSVSDGIFDRGKRSRAVAELAAISVALETYKVRFADYPDVETSRLLFDALDGKVGPKGDVLDPPFPPVLDAGRFSLGSDENPVLLDPWDVPYHYSYVEGVGTNGLSSFILFSSGPDGKSRLDGKSSEPENDDNLWPDS